MTTAFDEQYKSASVNTVDVLRPFTWLRMGWHDMLRCGWVSYLHGILFALFGGLVFFLARERFWLLAGAFTGVLIIAPIMATSLYALSRALERVRQLPETLRRACGAYGVLGIVPKKRPF